VEDVGDGVVDGGDGDVGDGVVGDGVGDGVVGDGVVGSWAWRRVWRTWMPAWVLT
jgi:hypothetical protein